MLGGGEKETTSQEGVGLASPWRSHCDLSWGRGVNRPGLVLCERGCHYLPADWRSTDDVSDYGGGGVLGGVCEAI